MGNRGNGSFELRPDETVVLRQRTKLHESYLPHLDILCSDYFLPSKTWPGGPVLDLRLFFGSGKNEAIGKDEIGGNVCLILMPKIQQMMFVAGETGEPSSETTALVEQIVHEQVFEMVCDCIL